MPRWFRIVQLVGAVCFLGYGGVSLVRGDWFGGLLLVALSAVLAVGPLSAFLRPLPPDSPEPAGDPHDLAAGPARPWILLGSFLGLLGILGFVRYQTITIVPFYLLAIGVVLVVQSVRRRRDEVRFTPDALVVVARGQRTEHAWDDVLELSWSSFEFPSVGSGPVVRIRGGSFDVPGPTAPLQIAFLPLWGRFRRAEAREQVRRAAARHGITFTDGLVGLIGSGKRMARLPGERS